MTVLTQAIWDIASHPIVHRPSHQAMGIGSFLVRHGFGLLQSTLNEGTSRSRILKGSVGSTLLGAGGYIISLGGAHLGSNSIREIASLFFSHNDASETREGLHPYEMDVEDHLGERFLHHNQSDSRSKVLWLTADYDTTGSLYPLCECGILERMASSLEVLTDLKYQVVNHPEQFCDAIQFGVKTGYLHDVIVHAHGHPSSIGLSAQNRISVLRPLPRGCFDGLPPDAKLFLFSCLCGSGLVPLNIAEWLAWESGITVYASKDYTNIIPTRLCIKNQNEIVVDFCAFDAPSTWEDPCANTCECSKSMTRIFHPPVTLLEKSLFTAKMGLSALLGFFTAYQLTRIPLMALSLASHLVLKARKKFL